MGRGKGRTSFPLLFLLIVYTAPVRQALEGQEKGGNYQTIEEEPTKIAFSLSNDFYVFHTTSS